MSVKLRDGWLADPTDCKTDRRTSDDAVDEGVARVERDGAAIDAVNGVVWGDGRGRDDAGRECLRNAPRRDIVAHRVRRARYGC